MKKLVSIVGICCSITFFVSCNKDLGGVASSPSDRSTGLLIAPGGGGSGSGNGGGTAGVITAGEWNDLDHWNFWMDLLQKDSFKTFPDTWEFYTDNRIIIHLKDINGQALYDARLALNTSNYSCSAVTDNSGKAELFPGLFTPHFLPENANLKVEYHGQQFDLGSVSSSEHSLSKTLPIARSRSTTVDIMFVVDATGSMGDELEYLKTEIKDVISRAGSQLPGKQLRMGSVFYRDKDDEYVVRPFGFTTDVNQLTAFINKQNANGGGDTPEAVDEGLDQAINQQQWSSSAINRLIILVLDAPSHKTPDVMTRLKNAITAAQQKGIRIIPVSASGIDKETEFLFRFFSISTNGTYVFITNDSGIGSSHLQASVGDYKVEFLNNLLVRLISRYGQE
ncbi:MAG: vWA domain-containing protein [Flavisolibacter sp.]